MLHRVLDSAGLEVQVCASLLGLNPQIFAEWASGQRPIPESYLPMLSAVLGVPMSTFKVSPKLAKNIDDADITPAIWYKLKGENLVEADRECVILIRQLGHYVSELEEVTKTKSVQWRSLFDSIRANVNLQAPPREQGRMAARMFRQSTSLGHGATGSGEVLRGLLRSMGVLLIETPLKESRIEGCSFYVGLPEAALPCVFANTHHVTWFRRNTVLMHEVGHSIFEGAYTAASLDFVDLSKESDAAEIRARAFAQGSLVPREVLVHVAQSHGIKWSSLSGHGLARIVAETHVELRTVVAAAVESGLVRAEDGERFRSIDISSYLPELSDHALTTEQYLAKIGTDKAGWVGKRTTTIPSRPIRLPVSYVNAVVDAYRSRQISLGKAAEFLMINDDDFVDRFGRIYEDAAD